jgi:hypothetical protein
MYDDPTILAIIGTAILGPLAVVAWGVRAAWRAWQRRTAYRRNVDAFLAAIKPEVAWAAVTGDFYWGADFLEMLRTGGVITDAEFDALVAAAEERGRREPPPADAEAIPALAAAVDDEIPF